MNDDMFYKLGAQVAALELITKTMISLHFTSTVKEKTGFAEAGNLAKSVGEYLRTYVRGLSNKTPHSDISELMLTEMEATISRCFEQAATPLDEIATLVLEMIKPPSDSKN